MSAYGHNGHSIRRHRNLLAPNISGPSLDLIGRKPDPDPFDTLFPSARILPSTDRPLVTSKHLQCVLTRLILSFEHSTQYSSIKLRFHFAFIPFYARLPSKPAISSLAQTQKFSYSPRIRGREPGEVTDQYSTRVIVEAPRTRREFEAKWDGGGRVGRAQDCDGGLSHELAVLRGEGAMGETEVLVGLSLLHRMRHAELCARTADTKSLRRHRQNWLRTGYKGLRSLTFDAAFHTRSIPPHVHTYLLDPAAQGKYWFRGIRRL